MCFKISRERVFLQYQNFYQRRQKLTNEALVTPTRSYYNMTILAAIFGSTKHTLYHSTKSLQPSLRSDTSGFKSTGRPVSNSQTEVKISQNLTMSCHAVSKHIRLNAGHSWLCTTVSHLLEKDDGDSAVDSFMGIFRCETMFERILAWKPGVA